MEDRKVELEKEIESLKNKGLELRRLGKESLGLELKIKKQANKIVKEFGGNKFEIGKAVTWLKDSYKIDEWGDTILNSIKPEGAVLVKTVDTELAKIPVRLQNGF